MHMRHLARNRSLVQPSFFHAAIFATLKESRREAGMSINTFSIVIRRRRYESGREIAPGFPGQHKGLICEAG